MSVPGTPAARATNWYDTNTYMWYFFFLTNS
jgi:hypothetical protein